MILYDTKFLQLKSTKSKTGHDWIYAHRPNSSDVVVILPIINNKILFLKEERPPLQAEGIAKYSISLPAGLVGDERKGETILNAISAELLEETGLKAEKIVIAAEKIASSPGCVSETFTIAIAYIKEYKPTAPPLSDGGVIVDRILVDKENLIEWLDSQQQNGILLTSQALAALFYLNCKKY